MEENLRERQHQTLSKLEQKTTIASLVQNQKRQVIRSRLYEAKLREEEIQAALHRRQKQDDYRVKMLQSRIESDNERARVIREQREELIRRRQQIKIAATRQKQELMESFYKMKVTKKYELPKHLQESLAVRPRSASISQSRSSTQSPPGPSSGNSKLKLPRRPASASARSTITRSTDWAPMSARARTRTSRSAVSDADSDLDDHRLGVQQDASEDEADNNEMRTLRSDIEDLRRRQNEELLHVLQQEHHAEEQREYLLNQVSDTSERSRMEQIFNQERAQASERIMKLTKQHEEQLAAKMKGIHP
ncbi:hypothetical protein PINS_up002836 [Pythium insidiosum]|nr:hypothetical protein PINS_up002836 [Pythium insidiosum]